MHRNNSSVDGGRDISGIIDVIGQDNPAATKGGPFVNIALQPVTGCSYRLPQLLDCNVLPVTLTSFTGELTSVDHIKLEWLSVNEIQFDHYELEYSINAEDWSTLTLVAATNKGSAWSKYEYLHLKPSNGSNYYRLKMIDRNGTTTYSLVVEVFMDNGEVSIQPNPFVHSTMISFSSEQDAEVLIYDLLGRLVSSFETTSPTTEISVGEILTHGTYIVTVVTKKGIAPYRIVKE